MPDFGSTCKPRTSCMGRFSSLQVGGSVKHQPANRILWGKKKKVTATTLNIKQLRSSKTKQSIVWYILKQVSEFQVRPSRLP